MPIHQDYQTTRTTKARDYKIMRIQTVKYILLPNIINKMQGKITGKYPFIQKTVRTDRLEAKTNAFLAFTRPERSFTLTVYITSWP